jgi:hypothetical protein
MSSFNSGQGGFIIDGKVHILDTDEVGAEGFKPEESAKSVVVDKTPKDISKQTKKTLADYLGKLTSEANNKYPVDGSRTVDISITTEDGLPIGPSSLSDPINNPQHAPKFTDPRAGTNTSPITSAGVTTTSPFLKSSDKYNQEDPSQSIAGYTKGKTNDPDITTGHDLLKSAQKNKLPAPLDKYTSAVLKNNRFNTGLPRATAADDFDGRISDSQFLPNDPKSLLKGVANNIELQHPQYGRVSLNRLAQVGNSLSLRASTEMGSFDAGNNPTGGTQDAAALLPGWQQVGSSRVDTVLLEAKDILDTLTSEEVDEDNFVSLGSLSWGSLNNVSDPFSGIQSIGMVALSIALTSALIVVFEGLGGLLSLVSPAELSPARDMSSGKWQKGKYRNDSEDTSGGLLDMSATALGIRSTVYPLGECIQKGVERFFHLAPSEGGGIGSAVSNAAQQAVGAVGGDGLIAPGHNVIICRTIIRSSVTIIDSFKELAKSSTIVSGARGVLDIIDTIRRSKIIAAINVFAALGDAYLSNREFHERTVNTSVSLHDNHNHRIRTTGKSDSEKLKLAWASNRAPSLYLIPDSILAMSVVDTKMNSFKGPLALTDEHSKTKFAIAKTGDGSTPGVTRIKSKGLDVKEDGTGISVEYIEKLLDSEYVPFYFHDLRTNEIISFHAFLTSLGENFTPKWESTQGLGRVDPVHIYASTERKIDLSFYVVATSESDFDDMWMKINKLVTLVYPQYTKGRQFESDDRKTKFTQPFSQLMSASPLIRLRLGDLIKSNYSKFALARLFGAGSPSSFKTGESKDFGGTQEKIQLFKKRAKESINQIGTKISLETAGWPAYVEGTSIGTTIKTAPILNIYEGDLENFSFTIKHTKEIDGNVYNIVEPFKKERPRSPYQSKIFADKYSDENNTMYYILPEGNKPLYMIPQSYTGAKIDKDFLQGIYKEVFEDDINNVKSISDFLNSTQNAIVRSFESVGGKGLAGKIDSLAFDWYDRVMWETNKGSVAPKMCKVTISFSPIHDISPGIDHMGYNRAPVYSVGKASNGEGDNE